MLTKKQKWDYALQLVIADATCVCKVENTKKWLQTKKETPQLTIFKKPVYCEIIGHFMFIKTGFNFTIFM